MLTDDTRLRKAGWPLVTVLMTVYNGLPYLREALESILVQTFTDFEFLIIDDASTDASVDWIRSYNDPRIRVECNDSNMGQAASLKRGLTVSRGRYIARLDQDDISVSDRLEKQVAFLERRPDVAVVGTWGYNIDRRGRRTDIWRRCVNDFGEFVGSVALGRSPLLHPSVMFRRDVVMDVGGYDASFAGAEDYDLWVRLAMRRHGAATVPEPLVLLRTHEERQSITRAAAQQRSMQRAHNRMVAAFCHPEEVQRVSVLLRIEDDLWTECRSRAELGAVLRAAATMVGAMQCGLNLSPVEFSSLTRTFYRRLGLGVTLGAKIFNWPAVFFYPVFFLLSPLLMPGVRRMVSPIAPKLRRLRYRLRMLVTEA